MAQLQPYPISEFKSAINNYLEPWARPVDAFFPLQNAYVYRGSITKRNGMSQFGNRLADQNPVMGIMRRINEATGVESLVVASTRNLYLYNPGTNTFNAITGISNSTFWYALAQKLGPSSDNFPGFFPNLVPGSISITGSATTTDDGAGNINPNGIIAAGSTVNYTTGVFTLNLTAYAATDTLSFSATTSDYFTGNNTNFFNYVNWQTTNAVTGAQSTSYLYMTNDVDPVTLFDGTSLSRPILYTNSARTEWVTTTQDVQVYKNSLLLFRPSLNIEVNALNQTVMYSAPLNPTNFIADIPGNGGEITAPTGDLFISEERLRDAIICFFTNSTWIFRYTGIASDPFHIDQISVNKRNAFPYGSVAYDERATSGGSTGFIACDGANVSRYDIPIIAFFEEEMSEKYYAQTYSQRYDNLNQTWFLFVSNQTDYLPVGTGAPGADQVLVYNHLENSWCTYQLSQQASCLGIYFRQTGLTWAQLTQQWQNTPSSWASFGNQESVPILLMGDVGGYVYLADDNLATTDFVGGSFNPLLIPVDIKSIKWNPVIKMGQKTQFSYIDFYYSLDDPTNPPVLTLSFFADNSGNTAAVQTLTLDGPAANDSNWKRIYTNLIGEFVRLEITGGTQSAFQILGMTLWAKDAGRLTF